MSSGTMGRKPNVGKGDADTRVDHKKYYKNRAKVKKVREFDTSGFKMKVNGVEVES